MKKLLSVTLVLSILILSYTVCAEEEYSNDADITYGYDKSYDESYKETKDDSETTSSSYDNIKTSYDATYDESYHGNVSTEILEGDYNNDNTGISVYVNGERLTFDAQPVLVHNRTMVPLRAIFEALGATVTWDNTTSTAKGVLKSTIVKITIGADKMYKNKKAIELDSPATMISDRTMVPVRAIAESFNCIVNWYDATQTVEILSTD